MIEIGSYEAKTHFASLLKRAHRGEEIILTRRGRPMAKMVPIKNSSAGNVEETIARLKTLRSKITAKGSILESGESWRDLAHEGHKW